MIEKLPSQKSFILDGEVLPESDYYDGIENRPEPYPHHLYDGVNMKSEAEVGERSQQIVDALVDGLSLVEMDAAVVADENKRSLAQLALFEPPSESAVISSLEQHPSNQNTTSEQQHELARAIVAEYKHEAGKKYAKLDKLRWEVFIAVTRKIKALTPQDLELIAKEIGYDKNFFRRAEKNTSDAPAGQEESEAYMDISKLRANDRY
jgi:tRNA uridine 5-carbamoylmethylation protein Kti12